MDRLHRPANLQYVTPRGCSSISLSHHLRNRTTPSPIASWCEPSGEFAPRPAQIPIQRFRNVLQRAKHASSKHLAVASHLFRARQAEKLRRSSRDASLGRSPGLVWCPRAAIVSMHSERTRCGYQLPAELGVRECAFFSQTRSLRRQMYV